MAERAIGDGFHWPVLGAGAAPIETAALFHARDVAAAARDEAEALLCETRLRCDAERRDARAEGLRQGREEATAEAAVCLGALREALARVEEIPKRWHAELEPQVLRLSVRIAEKLACGELAAKPERILDVVRAGMRLLPGHVEVSALVNDKDLECWRRDGLVPEDLTGLLQGSARVATGSCEVRSELGFVDGSLSAQVALVRRFMESGGDAAGGADAV
jgi:flagellar biosynthesis/type III secretory pathway protein FliH